MAALLREANTRDVWLFVTPDMIRASWDRLLSADGDLFVHARDAHRELVRALPEIGAATGTSVTMIRDAGTFVRASLHTARGLRDLDVVFEPVPDLEQPPPVEGVTIESLADLPITAKLAYPAVVVHRARP